MDINELKQSSVHELIDIAKKLNIYDVSRIKKQEIIFLILNENAKKLEDFYAEGFLEVLQDGFGFLRFSASSYLSGPDDIYVPISQVKKFSLRTGDKVKGKVRPPKEGEKYFTLLKIDEVNSEIPESVKDKIVFESLTPIHTYKKFMLENTDVNKGDLTSRIIDIIAPMGKGQRALLVSPPKAGKTIMLQNIAKSLITNHKEIYLIVLLIDERPEEVTDMVRLINSEVVASTFDEPASRHVQVSEMVIEKAKRLVEQKRDVVILLDSITRLARAYNSIAPLSGKVLTGGIDANALHRPKKFFGSARNIEEGGSLTIIATALIDTGSKMDEVIFEEFKGTGNSEIYLDRKISEKRVYPAINISKTGTRKEELLISTDELQKVWFLRKILHKMDEVEAIEFLLKNLKLAQTNDLFFELIGTKIVDK